MPELEYFVVAESFAVDRDTSAISIFNVLSEVWAENFPHTIPKLVALSSWICSPDEIAENANLQGEMVFRVPGQEDRRFRGNFYANSRFQNVVLDLPGLQVSASGDVVIELLVNGTHCAQHTIEIKPRPEA